MNLKINPIAAGELKEMMPFIAAANGITAAVSVVLGIVFGFDWRVYTGLVTGNILMTANFILIGYTAERTVKCKDFRRARFICNFSYGARYVGIFVVLAALLTADVISPVPAVIPLFFPKIYYTFFYVRSHGKDEES